MQPEFFFICHVGKIIANKSGPSLQKITHEQWFKKTLNIFVTKKSNTVLFRTVSFVFKTFFLLSVFQKLLNFNETSFFLV